MLGPVDPRDIIFTKTRLRTPSTDQCSRSVHIVRNAREQQTASSSAIQAQVAPSLGAPVSSRTLRRCLAEGHFGLRRPLHTLPLTPTHRHLRLEWCCARGYCTAAEWKQVIFSDESRFNLSSDDNRVCMWRPRAERLNPALALQRHSSHSWCDGIVCHSLQYKVTLSIDSVHHYSPAVCPRHPATICVATCATAPRRNFLKDNTQHHTARVS
ncbi:transposable element Tcb2 transposase [Trichonephila clavipes]|nr:transposable element Tcb2 transposase [Trichonephila clavipes]